MNLRDYKTIEERRNAIEKYLNVSLKTIGSSPYESGCENMIGVAQVPLGIAGPINGKYIPLATTEGALIASVNRGCKAITESGGAMVDSYRVGATRGPVFKTTGIKESIKLVTWINSHFNNIYNLSKTVGNHTTLKNIDTQIVGNLVFARFIFDTQDAMGMNMVTIATQKLVEYIEENTKTRCLSLAGNYDVDKKPSWLNVIEGRGFKVWAEVKLPEKVLRDILKTTAQKFYETWLTKCMIGTAMAGSMGFNSHFANIAAAIFLATGQDPAHVVEASVGMTTCEIEKNDLYISIYLPDLMAGIVGGGTGLATQKEALSIVRVKNSQEFAEIIGAAVLAGEISLLASLSEGTLAKAHQTYGRHR